jgi:hypothetical protein
LARLHSTAELFPRRIFFIIQIDPLCQSFLLKQRPIAINIAFWDNETTLNQSYGVPVRIPVKEPQDISDKKTGSIFLLFFMIVLSEVSDKLKKGSVYAV